MSETTNYAWDFDRPADGSKSFYSTFSVPIFQWLTKASGKGLKKSSAASRVLGYTAEPERVYAKALEICARLNREAASAADRPGWLQKQYSIPRPAGIAVQRRDGLSAGQVRAMRLRVMKERLLPAGFIAGKDASYIRRQGDQIHLVNFQGSKYGGEFTVNLGFHYVFTPPAFREEVLPFPDFQHGDALVRARIGNLLPAMRDSWFEYGKDREPLIANLQLCATTALSTFQSYGERWCDPAKLLADLSAKPSAWHSVERIRLGWIELKAGQLTAAETRVANWSDDRYLTPPAPYVWLRELVEEYRKQGSDRMEWKNWVV